MYEAITIPNEEIAAETASVVPSSSKRAEAASSARPGVIDEHLEGALSEEEELETQLPNDYGQRKGVARTSEGSDEEGESKLPRY